MIKTKDYLHKLLKINDHSLYLCIPKVWINEMGLKKGDVMRIHTNNNSPKKLIITKEG